MPGAGAGCCGWALVRTGGSGGVAQSMQDKQRGCRGGARHLCLQNRWIRNAGYGNAGGRTSSPTGQRHRLWTSDPWGVTLEGCAISLCLVPERHKACAAVVLLKIGPRMRAENRRPSARGRFLCRRSACSAACRRSGAQVGREGLFRLCKAGRGGTREPSGTCVWKTVGKPRVRAGHPRRLA